MRRTRLLRWSAVAACLLAVSAVAAQGSSSKRVDRVLYATTDQNQLIKLNARKPSQIRGLTRLEHGLMDATIHTHIASLYIQDRAGSARRHAQRTSAVEQPRWAATTDASASTPSAARRAAGVIGSMFTTSRLPFFSGRHKPAS
jgi:hypothetical protein